MTARRTAGKRIVLLGRNGQLGRALQEAAPAAGFLAEGLDSKALDVTDGARVAETLAALQPDIVINTCAYHVVPQCETHPLRALEVNCTAVHGLALVCRRLDAVFVTFSTDYVFDGTKGAPYGEDDRPNPLQIYGLSKLAGELACLNYFPEKTVVIRTSYLYGGPMGSPQKKGNFVLNILREAADRDVIDVSSEQVVSPTYAPDLADATLKLLHTARPRGVYHLVNDGHCRLSAFAAEILALAGGRTRVQPVDRGGGQGIRRPRFSALENARARSCGIALPPWRQGLAAYMKSLGY